MPIKFLLRRYAAAKNPVIEAITTAMFRFKEEEQALDLLKKIKSRYILAKEQPAEQPAVKLWIKGFSLTEGEKEKGYLGHYAVIRSKKLDGGEYTLYAEKAETELKHHPQKKRPKQTHPDWGHPLLRKVQKKAIFKNVEEARELLQALHKEYPEISIPLTNKLYLIIYSRKKKPPVQKYVLEIKVAEVEGGGFVIDYYENEYEKQKKAPVAGVAAQAGGEAPVEVTKQAVKGKFTSMIQLKKKKR